MGESADSEGEGWMFGCAQNMSLQFAQLAYQSRSVESCVRVREMVPRVHIAPVSFTSLDIFVNYILYCNWVLLDWRITCKEWKFEKHLSWKHVFLQNRQFSYLFLFLLFYFFYGCTDWTQLTKVTCLRHMDYLWILIGVFNYSTNFLHF